jgi:hypothetical protein
VRFDGGKSGFGGHICSHREAGEPFTDFVEKVSSNELWLASKYPDGKNVYVMSLSTGQ